MADDKTNSTPPSQSPTSSNMTHFNTISQQPNTARRGGFVGDSAKFAPPQPHQSSNEG